MAIRIRNRKKKEEIERRNSTGGKGSEGTSGGANPINGSGQGRKCRDERMKKKKKHQANGETMTMNTEIQIVPRNISKNNWVHLLHLLPRFGCPQGLQVSHQMKVRSSALEYCLELASMDATHSSSEASSDSVTQM